MTEAVETLYLALGGALFGMKIGIVVSYQRGFQDREQGRTRRISGG